MTKRSAEELHSTVAKTRLRVKVLEELVEKEEHAADRAERNANQKFYEFRQTDPDTLERWMFIVNERQQARIQATRPRFKGVEWVFDLYDMAEDAFKKSLMLANEPDYEAAADRKIAEIDEKWSKCIGEKMCEARFPDGLTYYFLDEPTARRFVPAYQRMVDEECSRVGLPLFTVRGSAIRTRMLDIAKTDLDKYYDNLYTPGLEDDFRDDLRKDAKAYVNKLLKKKNKQ